MSVAVVTFGSGRQPSLAELERVQESLSDRSIRVARVPRRHGSKFIAGWLRGRGVEADLWPDDAPAMFDGARPGQLLREPSASVLLRLDGHPAEVESYVDAAFARGLVALYVHAVAEPRVWNRHHGDPPGPWVYCGRGTPVGNETYAYEPYRVWMRSAISRKSPGFDPAVVAWIRDLSPEHYVVCSCAPAKCHGDWIVHAWRHIVGRTAARAG